MNHAADDERPHWVGRAVRVELARIERLSSQANAALTQLSAARALFEQSSDQRLTGSRAVVARVAELGALRAGISAAEAADIAWLLGDPGWYSRLVRGRGWTSGRLQDWLAAALHQHLLGQ